MPVNDKDVTRSDFQQLGDAIMALPDDAYTRLRGIVEGMTIALDIQNHPAAS